MSRRDFPALTGLRFFLALWVILHHLTGPGQKLEATALLLPHGLFTLIRGGYQAVTTFFVLSGFVLTRSYAATVWNQRNTLRYAMGRAARVYPVYLLSLVVVAPFIWTDQTPGKAGLCGGASLPGAGVAGRNSGELEYSCMVAFVRDVLLCGVPAGGALHLARQLAQHRPCRRGCLLPDARDVGGGGLRQYQAAGAPERLSDGDRGCLRLRFIAAAGASAARAGGCTFPAFAGAAGVIAYPGILPDFIDMNTALRPFNGILLIGLALGGGAVARVLSTRVAVYLGKSSYAMYILHVPILWWCLRRSPEFPPLLYVAIVIAVSAVVYGACEEPANRRLRSSLRDPVRQLATASR